MVTPAANGTIAHCYPESLFKSEDAMETQARRFATLILTATTWGPAAAAEDPFTLTCTIETSQGTSNTLTKVITILPAEGKYAHVSGFLWEFLPLRLSEDKIDLVQPEVDLPIGRWIETVDRRTGKYSRSNLTLRVFMTGKCEKTTLIMPPAH